MVKLFSKGIQTNDFIIVLLWWVTILSESKPNKYLYIIPS
jgi:hypothetical protein